MRAFVHEKGRVAQYICALGEYISLYCLNVVSVHRFFNMFVLEPPHTKEIDFKTLFESYTNISDTLVVCVCLFVYSKEAKTK